MAAPRASGPVAATQAEAFGTGRSPREQSWVTVLLLFVVAGVVESLVFGHLGAFTPLYLRQLGVHGSDVGRWTGVLAASAFVLGLPLAPFWGVWADRYSRKLIIVRSAYIEALLFLVAALSQGPWHLLAARLLVGLVLGNSGVQMAVQAAITPRARTGFAIGMIAAAPAVGTSVGPAMGGLIIAHGSIRLLLGLDAALTLLVAVAMTLLLREPARSRPTDARVAVLLRRALAGVLQSPLASRLFAALFVALLGAQLTLPYVPLHIQALYHGPAAGLAPAIGWLLTAAGVAGTVATPLWGRLGDRFGHVRVLRLTLLLSALALAAQAAAPTLGLFGGARLAYGAVQVSLSALTFAALAMGVPEEQRASILNLAMFPFYLAAVLAPAAATLLLPLGVPVLFLLSGVVSLLALPLLLAVPVVPRAAEAHRS